MIRFRVLAALGIMSAVLAATGCRLAVTDDAEDPSLPAAATTVGGTEVWDLPAQPDAESIGIEDGATAVFESRPSRPALFRLADGAELRLPVRYVAFNAIGSTDGSPVGVDLKTPTMPLERTADVYESVLDQLGLPTDRVTEFERTAAAASGTEWVRSDRVSGRFGDLELGLVARFSPHSGSGLVAVSGDWRNG